MNNRASTAFGVAVRALWKVAGLAHRAHLVAFA